MFSKKPFTAIGDLLERLSQFKREMFQTKSKMPTGTTLRREKCFEGIDFNNGINDNQLAVNHRFMAAVVEGTGTFVVLPLDKPLKTEGSIPKICGHTSKITYITFNPFVSHEVVSSSQDGVIKLWKIPDKGITKDTSICQSLMYEHKDSVLVLMWHPFAADVLLSIGQDCKCIIWNVRMESTFMVITMPGVELLTSVAWCPEGSKFVVLWKDQNMSIVEPRMESSIVNIKIEGSSSPPQPSSSSSPLSSSSPPSPPPSSSSLLSPPSSSPSSSCKKLICIDEKTMLTVGSSETSIILKLWQLNGDCMKLLKEEIINNNKNNCNISSSSSPIDNRSNHNSDNRSNHHSDNRSNHHSDNRCNHHSDNRSNHHSDNNLSIINANNDISFSTFFDRRQQMLHVFHKDNGCMRSYTITCNDVIFMSGHVISSYRALAAMPLQGLNTYKNEIARFYKIAKNICQVISIVGTPNKTVDSGKHQTPLCSAEQWFQGQPISQSSSPVVSVTIKKPEYSAKNRPSLSPPPTTISLSPPKAPSSSAPPATISLSPPKAPSSSAPPQSPSSSSSSFIHLTFSSPKINRKLTKGSSAESELCLVKAPDLIPRRNSSIGQHHYLYSDASPSSTPIRFDMMRSLTIGGIPPTNHMSPSVHNNTQPHLIQNLAYKGGVDRNVANGPPNLTPIYPLQNGLGHTKVIPKGISPKTRSHKSPTLSAVRLRRMKQKELMFQSSSSSSSNEGIDGVGKSESWNENPLWSQNKSKKHPSRPRSKGRAEGQQKHSFNRGLVDRCSIIDFGPLDEALNEVLNQNKSLSKSTCDISQISRRNDFQKLQRLHPIEEKNSKNIPIQDKMINKNRESIHSQFRHKNPIMNGYPDADHYRSAFSIVKPPNDFTFLNQRPISNAAISSNGVMKTIPHLNHVTNFHSSDQLVDHKDKNQDFKFEFIRLKPSSQLLRTISLKTSPSEDKHRFPLNRSKIQPSNSFSIQQMHKINLSTPHLAASSSVEQFHPLQSLQSSLQTITEDDAKFQSINGCYSSSSSSFLSEATLHSDHSTVNYEINSSYQRLSPSADSQVSGPDEISNSFVFKGPFHRRNSNIGIDNNVSEKDIFETCSRQKDEIDDLKKELTDKEVKIRVLEEQLKRISVCSDG